MAPKIVSTIRNPVTPRIEEAPGITTSATVPGSVMMFRGRNIPAVLGTSPLMAHRTHTGHRPAGERASRIESAPDLRVGSAEISGEGVVLDGGGDLETNPGPADAVAVHVVHEGAGSVGPGRDLGAHEFFRVVDEIVAAGREGLGAIANDESPHCLLSDIAGGDLCPEIPQGLLGHPDVGAQQGEDRFVRFPPVIELEPGDAQPLLKYLRVVAGRAPRQSPPQVKMVGRRHGEADDFPVPENGFHHVDVRYVHPAAEGIVHDEDVPRLHLPAVLLQEGFHGVRHRTQVQRYGDALGDHLPACVAQGGGVIQAVSDDGGVGGAVKGQRHLVRTRGERILNDFTSDGVDP